MTNNRYWPYKVVEGDGSFSIEKPMLFKDVTMLPISEVNLVLGVNACIWNRRIKDIKPRCFQLLRYNRFLDANDLKWVAHGELLQYYPIFLSGLSGC